MDLFERLFLQELVISRNSAVLLRIIASTISVDEGLFGTLAYRISDLTQSFSELFFFEIAGFVFTTGRFSLVFFSVLVGLIDEQFVVLIWIPLFVKCDIRTFITNDQPTKTVFKMFDYFTTNPN